MKKMLLGRCVSCNEFVHDSDFRTDQQLDTFAKKGLCHNCQGTEKYDANYFIQKFEQISDDLWTESGYSDGDKHCALGHCGELNSSEPTVESENLDSLFSKHDLRVSLVNDGMCSRYTQESPKTRILAALYDIKVMEESIDV
jgi:hypothetical protein